MIARFWRGWTSAADADAYETLLRTRILPHIAELDGSRGAHLLRRDEEDGVEFVTITYFDGMDAVRAFAGEHLTRAVVPPEARALLARFDEHSVHYEVLEAPEPVAGAGEAPEDAR